jgi:hypothetical protein
MISMVGGQPGVGTPMPSMTTNVHAACSSSSSPNKETFVNSEELHQAVAGTAEGVPHRERRKARKTTHGLVRKLQREAP